MIFLAGSTFRPLALSFALTSAIALLALPSAVLAQSRVRFPSAPDPYASSAQTWSSPLPPYTPPTSVPGATLPPATSLPPSGQLPTGTAPYVPPTLPATGATLGQQIVPFDPYAHPQNPLPAVPPLVTPPGSTQPALPLPPASLPPALPPSTFPSQTPVYPPATGTYVPPPPLNGSAGVPQPTPLFPHGLPWGSNPQRLFQDTGFLWTFLHGDDGDDLEMHDVEVYTTLVINTYGRSPTGLRISPGFIFHFLDGPATGSDLPAQLYSAYVQAAWAPQFTPQFGADLAFRAGAYSDFDTVTFHSVRFTGHGLGVLQLTPTVALKLGIEYLDRAQIKLLPAGGIVWTPNPQTRYDIYFPRPKFSRYWRSIGSTEVWWHIAGEYGGGSWTIDRVDAPLAGVSDRIDINDLRLLAGIEWNQGNYRRGLFQIGYVFDRELTYKVVPTDSMEPSDTFLIRGGISF